MNDVTKAVVNMIQGVIPFVGIIIGMVQWCKVSFKITDESILNVLSMAFGVLVGTGYMLAVELPVNFTGWFLLTMYGITLGLTASGLFKAGAQMADRSAALAKVATTTTVTTVEAKPDAVVVPPIEPMPTARFQPPANRER